MAELSVTATDKTEAELAADEIAQALTEGAKLTVNEDTVAISPAFVALALAAPPTIDLAKNTFKAIALGILRRALVYAMPTRVAPTGTIDGLNDTFTVPANTLLFLFTNGVLRQPGGVHYTLSGTGNVTITYAAGYIPEAGDVHDAIYW